MNGSMLKTIAKKRPIILFTAVTALLGMTYITTQTMKESQRLSTLNTGVQTCFSRVQQSFTARMLGDLKGQYLTSEFTQNTERCFGEASKILAKEFSSTLGNTGKVLNSLSKDVHWFHERISPDSDAFTESSAGVIISNIGGRFEKLENAYNQVTEEMALRERKIAHALQSFYVTIGLIGSSLFLLFGWELKELRWKTKEKQKLEEEANALLDKNDMSALKVKEVLKRGLEVSDLYNCSDLFSQFHFYQTQVGSEVFYQKPEPTLVAPKPLINSKAEADRIWELSDGDASHLVVYDEMFVSETEKIQKKYDRAPKGTHSVNLDEVVSNIIDHQSQKYFTKGFQVEFNIDESHFIYSREEELHQILHSAINLMTEGRTTSLALGSRKLGSAIVLDIEVTGVGFEDHLIKKQIGFVSSEDKLPTDLTICKELSANISAKMSYDNLYDDVGATVGKLFRLTFKEAPVKEASLPQKKVIQVTKGSKKEILQRMQS